MTIQQALLDDYATKYKLLRAQIEALKAQQDLIGDELRKELDAMKLDTVVTDSGHRVSYKCIESARVSTKLVRNMFPDVARACTETTITTRLTVA